jgi:hypothetical protein
MTHHSAYEKGILPSVGGLDDQNCNYLPIMTLITAAIHAEEQLERENEEGQRAMADASQQRAQTQGSIPLMPNNMKR